MIPNATHTADYWNSLTADLRKLQLKKDIQKYIEQCERMERELAQKRAFLKAMQDEYEAYD